MKFKARQFFVSYTQKGVFLDRQVRRKLLLDENDIVAMELSFEDRLARKIYAIVKAKEKWDQNLEKMAYGKHWYTQEIISKMMEDKSRAIIGYVDWINLVSEWDVKGLLQSDPNVEIKKCGKLESCKKLVLKVISAPSIRVSGKKMNYEIVEIVREKDEILLWCHTDETQKKPLNLRRTGLETLPLLGVERKTILRDNGISTILQLISCPLDKVKAIKGISYNLLEKWILDSSKALSPSAYPAACQVFLTEPRDKELIVTESTHVNILGPYYSQFFVRGHSRVESRILGELQEKFGGFYNISMKQETTVTMISKDGSREINIFGPWIVEMFGFKRKDKAEELLEDLEVAIQAAFGTWGKNDVVLLISLQETYIEADQILDALVGKLSVQYSDPKLILQRMKLAGKVVVDANILIDGRLSYLIMRAMSDTEDYSLKNPEIIIPNVVTYEIKSMIDRPAAKNVQCELADLELQRLRALSDASYINIKHLGDIPQIPPITQHNKGTWRFYSSLRDEYILKILEAVEGSTLVTEDGRLARSAYIKGFEVIHIKPLIKAIKEDYDQEIKGLLSSSTIERNRILDEMENELLVSRNTLIKIIKLHSLAQVSTV